MRLTVDVSDCERMLRRAERELGSAGERMHKVADMFAQRAARDHAYRNRTGHMTASTNADMVENSANETRVEFGSTAEYASFLERGGWSTLREHALEAEDEIQEDLEKIAERIDS